MSLCPHSPPRATEPLGVSPPPRGRFPCGRWFPGVSGGQQGIAVGGEAPFPALRAQGLAGPSGSSPPPPCPQVALGRVWTVAPLRGRSRDTPDCWGKGPWSPRRHVHVAVMVSWGGCNKGPQSVWLQTARVCELTAVGPEIRTGVTFQCPQGRLLLEAPGRILSFLSAASSAPFLHLEASDRFFPAGFLLQGPRGHWDHPASSWRENLCQYL